MKKSAAPSFVKMWDKLSPTAREVITKSLPSSYTRQLSRTPLGDGLEGLVYPSVTGSVGDSAIKYFPDLKQVERWASLPIIGSNAPVGPLHASMMRDVVKHPLGDLSLAQRAATMQQRPDIFPRIYGVNPRGFTLERLTDLSQDTLQDLHTISTNPPWRHARESHKARTFDRLSAKGVPDLVHDALDSPSIIRNHREALNNLGGLKNIFKRRAMRNTLAQLEDMYRADFDLRPKDALPLITPAGRKFRLTQTRTPWTSSRADAIGQPKVTHPDTDNPLTISDVFLFKKRFAGPYDSNALMAHNIMRGADGRIVFSDPVFRN